MAKREFRNKTLAWMAPFNKCGISMATTKGESLLAGGTGELFACSVRVVIGNADKYRLVPVNAEVTSNRRKKAKKKAAPRAKADVPRVVKAPDGNWDIRTKTHYWIRGWNKWVRRSAKSDSIGMYTKRQCPNSLPAARAAWKAMKRGSGKQGGRRAAS